MQRVVRSTLVGLLTIAGITACGDKVTIPQGTTIVSTPPSVVHQVTVSPPSLTLNVGDKSTLAASVDADAGVTDRTVTWSSANTAIATVDANGVVTAVAAGNTSIIAASKADPTVKGAASVTVGQGANATVTISSINTTVCVTGGGCSSVPANLGNTTGQLDVVLNVDPGTQKLAGVDLLMNCNAAANFPAASDTVVATQSLTGTNVAPVAEAASAPVTLSFNTASFNSTTGATAFKNGSCVLRARARTTAGTTVASSSQSLTLANTDVLVGSITSTKTATDAGGLQWNGGDVTVSVVPVFFTAGRTAATTTVTFEGKSQQVTNTAGGAASATFTDGNGANAGGATDIDGITDPAAGATLAVSVVDAQGQAFATNPCGANLCSTSSVLAGAPAGIFPATAPLRLDTRKPTAGTLAVVNNTLQNTGPNGYIGSNFRFVADSAAGFRGPNANTATTPGNICTNSSGGVNTVTCNADNGGVDRVTVVFQTAAAGTSKTSSSWTNTTSTANLNETNTAASLIFRQLTSDALGNVDTSATTAFGVDKTAPTITQAGGPANNTANRDSSKTIGGTGSYIFTISDNLAGPRPTQLVAQTSLTSAISTSTTLPPDGSVFTNGNENPSGCIIGRFNTVSANAGPNALPVFERAGSQVGFCTPTAYTLTGGSTIAANFIGASNSSSASANNQGYFTTEVVAVDQAGNTATPIVKTVFEDAQAPVVSSVDLPGSITGNATTTIPASATDNVDLTSSFAIITYNTPTGNGGASIQLQYPTTSGPGSSTDNQLTRSATIGPVIPNFIKNLQVNTGAGAVTPVAGGNATNVLVSAADEVGNAGQLAVPFAPAVSFAAGASSTFAGGSTFSGSFVITSNTANVSDCPTAGCGAPAGSANPANPTSATLTATAQGTTGTFNNPFSGGNVGIWYQTAASAANNLWFFAGSAAAGSARDTGVGGSRFWDYVFTFTPPKVAPDGTVLTGGAVINVRAIGTNTNGDAMATPAIALTLTNP